MKGSRILFLVLDMGLTGVAIAVIITLMFRYPV